jgi:hypothetical protein
MAGTTGSPRGQLGDDAHDIERSNRQAPAVPKPPKHQGQEEHHLDFGERCQKRHHREQPRPSPASRSIEEQPRGEPEEVPVEVRRIAKDLMGGERIEESDRRQRDAGREPRNNLSREDVDKRRHPCGDQARAEGHRVRPVVHRNELHREAGNSPRDRVKVAGVGGEERGKRSEVHRIVQETSGILGPQRVLGRCRQADPADQGSDDDQADAHGDVGRHAPEGRPETTGRRTHGGGDTGR